MIDWLYQNFIWFEGRELYFFPYIFSVLLFRYLILSGGGYLVFWVWFPNFFKNRKIQKRPIKKGQILTEIKWSLSTLLINSCFGTFLLWLYFQNKTQVYVELNDYGYWYLGPSLVMYFLLHDAYFYWMHRALHTRFLLKHVHRIHHSSINPTPFAAFCFHPLEGFLEIAFVLPLMLLIPIHFFVLLIFLSLTHLFNVNGHLNYETLPPGAWDKWWGKWLTTGTHHNLHHQYYSCNYALYVRYWDQWAGTLDERTGKVFKTVTENKE